MIGRTLHILGLAVLAVLVFASPASADPVTAVLAAVGTAFKATITVAALKAAAIRFLVSTALSMALKKYQQRKQREPGIQTSHTTTGGTDPQGTVLGRYATAGHLNYHNSHGGANVYLTHVVELGDLPGASLRRLIIDGEYSELGEWEDGLGYPILTKSEGVTNRAWIRYYDGSQTEADAKLVEHYGDDEERPWTGDHILTGLNYAVLTFYRRDRVFPQGRPEYRFELDGPAFYDLRKDSTAGGAGTHRWADKSTWEPTDNPMVIAYNVLRGITLPCGSIWGGDFPAEDLPFAEWVAAMDACDVVTGPNNRPRFRAGFEVRFQEPPADFLDELFSAANAEVVELGGYWYPLVGGPIGADAEITDDDLLVSESWQHDPFPGLEGTFNAVTISHPSPGALWNSTTLETIVMDDLIAEDGTQRLFELKLPMVFNSAQGRQLGHALLKENRRFRSHRLPLPGEYFGLRPLRALNLTLADYGYASKSFRITEVAYDLLTLNVSVSLRESDPTDFDPDLALELPDVPTVTGPVTPANVSVSGLAAYGASYRDNAGNIRGAGVRFVWDASLEDIAEGLVFQVKASGQSEKASASTADLSSGEFTFGPLIPATDYQVRAKPLSRRRGVEWSVWLPVTTPDVRISSGEISEELWEAIGVQSATVTGTLLAAIEENRIAPLESEIQRVDRQLELEAVQQRSSAEALAIIGDNILWAYTRLSDVESRLADAGITVDPETGSVRVYGVEESARQISEVELRVSAAEASLTQSATRAWVNQQISYAVTDPTQIPLLNDLQLIVNRVVVDLNAANARIDLKSDQTIVDGLSASLLSAWTEINAAKATLALGVTRDEYNTLEARQQSAEFILNSLNGPSISQSVADTRYLANAQAMADMASLADLIAGYEQGEALRRDIAYAAQDIRARVDADRVARAAAETRLGAEIEGNLALLKEEQRVRADQNSARVSEITTLQATTAAQAGAITEINRVAANSASGIARAVHQMQLDVEAVEGEISTTADALQGVITRVTANEADILAVSQYALDLNTRLANAETGLAGQAQAQQQITARVTGNENTLSVHSQELNALRAEIDDPVTGTTALATAIHQVDAQVVQQGDDIKAETAARVQLATEVGENRSEVEEVSQTVDGIMAEKAWRLNVNGHVAGMVARVDLDDNNVPVGQIGFVSDIFRIVSPDGAHSRSPFIVYTSDFVVDGVTVPAGVYLRRAAIRNAFITRAMLERAIIGAAEIEDASIDTLHLAGQAVTVPGHQFEAGPVSPGGSFSQACKLTFARHAGFPTKVDVSFHHTGIAASSRLQVQITRQIGSGSETVLRSFTLGFGGEFGRLEALTIEDANTAGGNTKYRVNVARVGSLDPGETAPLVRDISIYATQFKR
ncbi:hypothetical protein PXK01_16720 [Phaeobacter sp. PT47_59]|uniref:hypothetical protein n=1 Tax=Phaeobacter sp. PT47_59 TaxID=3029979 RepID=UPI002380BE0E|nr:hypothetical protein [Phaeobacter sp. PT47_59]MDE4175808.1 hypothetical protein [Phaeobacter sp. PT47_59]